MNGADGKEGDQGPAVCFIVCSTMLAVNERWKLEDVCDLLIPCSSITAQWCMLWHSYMKHFRQEYLCIYNEMAGGLIG